MPQIKSIQVAQYKIILRNSQLNILTRLNQEVVKKINQEQSKYQDLNVVLLSKNAQPTSTREAIRWALLM